ncbi:MAG TPA: efflux RND transporter periplasmic adaptor subunit [Thermoanaerobaculia bacterium]|nr:efflux RND transporter periplasmic adaptor subunit [Thermoanaerobaculia bacterium]
MASQIRFQDIVRFTTLLAMILALAACNREGNAARGGFDGRPAAVVNTAPVEQGTFVVESRYVGTLNAESSADLYPRVSGPIIAIHAGSGDRVRKGQLLAQIDPDEATRRVEQSRAAGAMARATLSQRKADLEIAQANARRTENLFEQNLVSERDWDVAKAEAISAAAQLELGKAQIEQANANLRSAMLELQKTRIVAPFDGFIGKRYVDLGDQASDNRAAFSVVNLSTIRMTVAIPARDAARITRGKNAVVTSDVVPGRRFEGEVTRIASIFDTSTNTVEAEVEVANPDGALKPGMFATVVIAHETEPTALLVPVEAVIESETERWIFVAEKATGSEAGPAGRSAAAESGRGRAPGERNGPPPAQWTARRVPVRVIGTALGGERRAAVEPLEADLSAGMEVIVLGQQALTDGAPINIAPAGRAS